MTNLSRVSTCFLRYFLFLLILSGCGNNNVRVDKEYNNRISNAKLEFAPVENILHTVSVYAKEYKEVPQFVKDSSGYQAKAILQDLPSTFSPVMVHTAQDRSGLNIKTEGDAEFSLILTLQRIKTFASDAFPRLSALEKYEKYLSNRDSNPVRSTHLFAYEVMLKDNKTGNEIWTGDFELGVSNYSKSSESQVNFANSVREFATSIAVGIDRSRLVKRDR